MIREYQIALLLRTAKEQLTYCEIITNQPAAAGKRNFDTVSQADNFYKSVCNVFFHDSLLIISSLFDDKDKRVISFKNLLDFYDKKKEKINKLIDDFSNSPLKQMRDQIIAHQDTNNRNNNIPNSRRRGIINPELLKLLQKFLESAINEFRDYASKFKTSYSDQYFDTSEAKQEIELILSQAKPVLTDNFVI